MGNCFVLECLFIESNGYIFKALYLFELAVRIFRFVMKQTQRFCKLFDNVYLFDLSDNFQDKHIQSPIITFQNYLDYMELCCYFPNCFRPHTQIQVTWILFFAFCRDHFTFIVCDFSFHSKFVLQEISNSLARFKIQLGIDTKPESKYTVNKCIQNFKG